MGRDTLVLYHDLENHEQLEWTWVAVTTLHSTAFSSATATVNAEQMNFLTPGCVVCYRNAKLDRKNVLLLFLEFGIYSEV